MRQSRLRGADRAPDGRLPLDRESELHFFVKPGHEIPKAESVLERHGDYYVVAKPEEARPVLKVVPDIRDDG